MANKYIIRALECCTTEKCWECPFEPQNSSKGTCGCCEELIQNVADLINNQQEEIEEHNNNCEKCGAKTRECIESLQNNIAEKQAEIEKLNVELVGMRGACNSYKMHYDNTKAELERLQTETKYFSDIGKMYSEIRAEAIKEFAGDIYEEIDKAIKNNQDVKKQRRKRLIWRGNNVENDTFLHYVEGKIDALKGIKYFVFDYVKEMVGEQK